jgi:hypothetical protein
MVCSVKEKELLESSRAQDDSSKNRNEEKVAG